MIGLQASQGLPGMTQQTQEAPLNTQDREYIAFIAEADAQREAFANQHIVSESQVNEADSILCRVKQDAEIGPPMEQLAESQ